MKTFLITTDIQTNLLIEFLKKSMLAAAFLFLMFGQAMAQGTLTGFIVDEEFNEPLEKAVVTIPGTFISVLTDQQGKYSLKLIAGDYFLEMNHPGYYGKKYNISMSADKTTPMFIVKLKSRAVGRILKRKITSFEGKLQFSQCTEILSGWKVNEQSGNQEFNEILRTIPSAAYRSNGSGFGDSGIGFRGNDPTHTSYTFDGIVLNNPETGLVSSTAFSGLTDRAGQIQVVTGQAANMQSQTKSGGLVNVLSYEPRDKPGFDVLAVYGAEGFLKTAVTGHSGLSKKRLASTVQVSRTTGNGLARNTAFEQYGLFANIQKELNHFHTLVLNLNMVLQQHDRNPSDSIGAYNRNTIKYNKQWGYLNGKQLSWSTGYGRNPMISLAHFWQRSIKTHVSTQLVAQFNRTARLLPGGRFNGKSPDLLPKDTDGLNLFDHITDWNQGLPVPRMGAIRLPDKNNVFMSTEYSGISTLSAIDSENRFGLRSVITHNFSKNMDLSGSFNLEQYHASHFGAVHDLLASDGYFSLDDNNRPEGYVVKNLFEPKFFTTFNSADKTRYFYESGIQTGGLSLRLNYQLSRIFFYLEGSASIQNLRRTDHFNYLTTDPERQTKFILLPGGRAQTGIRLNLWNYHSVNLRTSYGSYQPLFTSLFPSGTNWKNQEGTNEQVFDTEVGYTIFSRRLKIKALVYRSQISNRQMVRYSNLRSGDSYGVINGLGELHQGFELKSAYKITRNIQFNLNGSLGDWKYTKDAKARIYDAFNFQKSENDLGLKGVLVPNAPQLSFFTELEWRMMHNLYLRLNYFRADQLYAPFSLYDFQKLASRNDFKQWQMPSCQLLGVSGNYLMKIKNSQTLNFFFGANNLLDSGFIEQSATNWNEKHPRFIGNQVQYGTGRTWFAGLRYQF